VKKDGRGLEAALEMALQAIPDPAQGLPDPVFRFVLKLTPMINVDLLVRNEKGEHLLAWREDSYGKGWHIPGGIIRFKEPIERRIAAVARTELSAEVEHTPHPVDLRELSHTRGHFISLLYLCRLRTPVSDPAIWYAGGPPHQGQISWFTGSPPDIYWVHNTYAEWLNGRAC
jgi:ADP-ribose pyrophosphatase YjhB (NUDIX family)